MAEWFKATVLKAVGQQILARGFKSLFLRQFLYTYNYFLQLCTDPKICQKNRRAYLVGLVEENGTIIVLKMSDCS